MWTETIALRELRKLEGEDLSQPSPPEDSVAPLTRALTMMRNRDMLLCYLRTRMDRIESARWDMAGPLPADALEVLSAHEREYARKYGELLTEYQDTMNIDLTRYSQPPSELYIKVRVNEEVGEIVGPETGATIDLRAGDIVYLRRGDVEPLIRQGKLTHIDA